MNKRGISVAIASVLLILLVVILFSVVGMFMKKGPEETIEVGSEKIEEIFDCDDVSFKIEKICSIPAKANPGYTYGGGGDFLEKGGIKIVVKNNKKSEIDMFRIKYSSGGTTKKGADADIKAGTDTPKLESYAIKPVTVPVPLDWPKNWKEEWIKIYPIVNGKTCTSKEYELNMVGIEECPP